MASAFEFAATPLEPERLRAPLADPACGGYASFEGWVRDHNEGRRVRRLEYEAYVELAVREGARIVAEAERRFGVRHVRCVHRVGALALGELAVWVGVAAGHRAEAFAACRWVIDEVKHRVPIWKKEHYVDGDSGWVNCERCAQAGEAADGAAPEAEAASVDADGAGHARDHDHDHDHDHGHRHGHGHGHLHEHDQHRGRDRGHRPDYSRQVVLPEVGAAGQARIRRARVLVVGAGGLGVPVLGYLAGAGVGVLGVCDGDRLEASNLHRQVAYALDDVGRAKALLARDRLRALNPEVDVRAYVERATAANLPALAADYDVLVDCSDNFATKFLVSDVAVRLGRPAVLASVYQYEGQLQMVRPGGACLRCLWPEATRDGLVGNCAEAGVLGPVPGVLGSLQALEVLKTILGLPTALGDDVLLVDLGTLATRRLRARRAPACAGRDCVRIEACTPVDAAVDDVEVDVEALGGAPAAGYVVVDVREPAEIAAAPAPVETLAIPLDVLLDAPRRLEAGRRYLLLCARGQRATVAARALRAAGIATAWALRGGLAALDARARGA